MLLGRRQYRLNPVSSHTAFAGLETRESATNPRKTNVGFAVRRSCRLGSFLVRIKSRFMELHIAHAYIYIYIGGNYFILIDCILKFISYY